MEMCNHRPADLYVPFTSILVEDTRYIVLGVFHEREDHGWYGTSIPCMWNTQGMSNILYATKGAGSVV